MTNQQGAPEAPTAAQIIARFEREDGYRLEGAVPREWALEAYNELRRLAALVEAQQPAPSAASKAVLAAIRAANMQLVRTGDDEFMLVTFKQATAQAIPGVQWQCGPQASGFTEPQPSPTLQADSQPAPDPADIIAGALQISRGHAMELMQQVVDADRAARAQADSQPAPIDMVLHCPKCGLQHIDASEPPVEFEPGAAQWSNPSHRSHLCHGCGHIWRPADVPTNGVAAVKTTGKADSPIAARAPADSVLEDAARLEQIAEAIRDYHHALDMRKHGGLAESAAFSSICNTMGMNWNRGEEAARRAARKQGGAT